MLHTLDALARHGYRHSPGIFASRRPTDSGRGTCPCLNQLGLMFPPCRERPYLLVLLGARHPLLDSPVGPVHT